jgi:hypothetical protein
VAPVAFSALGGITIMRWGAVEESVCQWCGARIYLVRVSPNFPYTAFIARERTGRCPILSKMRP